MEKMFQLPMKTRKEHEMQAKHVLSDPQTFADMKKTYEEQRGEHTVLSFFLKKNVWPDNATM